MCKVIANVLKIIETAMKNLTFFEKKFLAMSKARKINAAISILCSISLATMIATAWALGGCEFIICLLGAIMGILSPIAIGMMVDDYLVK